MPPVTVMVKPVSGACNMRCRYCFYADEMARRAHAVLPAMTLDMLETLVRRVMVYAEGEANFVFQGGEPTLAGVDFYRHLVRLQRQYSRPTVRISNAIQTNGLALSGEMIAFLAEQRFLVGVSLDGCAAVHDSMRRDTAGQGTFRRVCGNVRRLREAGAEVNILCVVNGETAAHAREVLDALEPLGYLQLIPCLDGLDGTPGPSPLTDEAYGAFLQVAFDRYERAFRQGRLLSIRYFDNLLGMLLGIPPESCSMQGICQAGFVVESTGDVYPCDFYALDAWRMGNLQDMSLRQLARSAAGERFRREAAPVPEACRVCASYDLCRNGCRRERDPLTGQYRFCAGMRAFLLGNRDRMEAMARALAERGLQHGQIAIRF